MKGEVIITILCIGGVLSGCVSEHPSNLGVRDGRLAACPKSPNCVSSQSADPEQAVAPLTYTGIASAAMADLRKIIAGMKSAVIISETNMYLHIEFTSTIFRFVDDVEFVVDESGKQIHVRSASRIGYFDLGVNRGRVGRIRNEWEHRKKLKHYP
jgi:uncharacterized protein (DUF1499 family)